MFRGGGNHAWLAVYDRIFEKRRRYYSARRYLPTSLAWKYSDALKPSFESLLESTGISYSDDGEKLLNMQGVYFPEEFLKEEYSMQGIILDTFTQYLFDMPIRPVNNELDILDFIHEGPYEYAGVFIEPGDVVFDLGAFVGDFSILAAKKGAKVYAFEPSQNNMKDFNRFQSVNKWCNGMIEIIPKGIGLKEETLYWTENGGASQVSKEYVPQAEKIEIVSIDGFVEKEKIHKVDFIKADIEGMETEMLIGARRTLKEFAPKLALCTYHKPDDPQNMEELIRSANPDYKVVHRYKKLFAWVETG